MARTKRQFSYRFSVENAEKTKKDFKEIGDSAKKGLGKVDPAAKSAARGMDQASRSSKKLHTVTLSLGNSSNTLTRTLKRLAGVAVLGALTRNTIQTALAFEKVQIGMETALGSSEAAAETFEFLREQVDRVGLPLLETADSFKKLAASARGTALEGQPVLDLFVGLTEAAAVYRLSQEQVNGVFKAYTDSISKGFVQMEELKGQLGDRLPGVLRLAAEGLGVTTAELIKLVETGKLATDDFLPAFNKALQENVAGGVAKASVSALASFNRFNNAIDLLQNTFAEAGFLDSVKEFVNMLTAFLTNDSVMTGAKFLGTSFKVIADAIRDPEANLVDPIAMVLLEGIVQVNELGADSLAVGLRTTLLNFKESVLGSGITHTNESVAKAMNDSNEFLQGAFREQQQIVDSAVLKLTESAKLKNVATKGLVGISTEKPTEVSKGAELLIQRLREDAAIAQSSGAVRAELEKQQKIRDTITRLEKAAARDNAENFKINIELSKEQRAEAALLVSKMSDAIVVGKQQKQVQKVLQEIREEYVKLTPTVDDNIVEIKKWKEETLKSLDETSEAYQKFAEMVEVIFKEKIGKAQDDALEKTEGFAAGIERGVKRLEEESITVADSIENAFVDMSNGIGDALQEMVETGKFDLDSLRDLASDVLRSISRAILQEGVVNPLAGLAGTLIKGAIGGISGNIAGSLFHEGGVVGSSSVSKRNIPSSMFMGAPRLHNGLFLKQDEFPAILQKGEQVIPKNSGSIPRNIVINVTTPDSNSFLQNKGQIASTMFGELSRQARRNG